MVSPVYEAKAIQAASLSAASADLSLCGGHEQRSGFKECFQWTIVVLKKTRYTAVNNVFNLMEMWRTVYARFSNPRTRGCFFVLFFFSNDTKSAFCIVHYSFQFQMLFDKRREKKKMKDPWKQGILIHDSQMYSTSQETG